MIFLPIEEAKVFVHKLELKSGKEWQEYSKSGKKPDNIPAAPVVVYTNKGWKGMGDWLGTDRIATHKMVYLSFEEAKKFVYKLKLGSRTEWFKYLKSGKRPANLPAYPDGVYKDEGWKGWGDFLGNGMIAPQNKVFLKFEEAREIVHKLGLKRQKEWQRYCKIIKNMQNIPSSPEKIYKDEWISWGDWLGTGNVHPKNKIFLSFEDAREFVHKLKLKSHKEWREYCKSNKKPEYISSSPYHIYKNKGWISWPDFLGY